MKSQAFIGFFIILLVIVPWHLAVGYATNWEWLAGFYYKHNVYRFTNEMEGHGGIFLLTWLYVLIGMLPLVVFLPQSLWQAWKDRNENKGVSLYILLAALSVVMFFSVSSTKLPNYTVPAYPFLGILIGSFIYQAIQKVSSYFTLKISLIIYTLLMLIFPIAVSIGIKYDEALSHLSHLGYYLGLLPIGALLALVFVFRKNLRAAVLTQVLSFMATTLLFFWLAFPQIDRENPLRIALPKMDKAKPTVGYKIFNPAFVFYLEKEIKKYEDLNAFKAAIQDLDEVYIITRKEHV
ncbi:MAG: glycosyltransferase family 39 protein, partial [Bacteroidota bacterium]